MAIIYMSSTFKDLEECREKVKHNLERMDHKVIAMENYVAEDKIPVEKCQDDVTSCGLYIGIFAWRYGYVPDGYDKSITELEYRKAIETGKDCLIFLLHEDAPWPGKFVDIGKDAEKIRALRDELSRVRMVSFFKSADELAGLVGAAVYKWEIKTIKEISNEEIPLPFEVILKIGETGENKGQLKNSRDIAIDSKNNIFISDGDNYRIQKFSSKGEFITSWGSRGHNEGEFDDIRGIAVDKYDHIYIADFLNNRVQKFSENGQFLNQFKFDNEKGVISTPYGIAISKFNEIYLTNAEPSNLIMRFNENGKLIRYWGEYGKRNGEFDNPLGITIDEEGNVYIADNKNHRIQKFNREGTFLMKWGHKSDMPGNFIYPRGIAYKNNQIYVSETDIPRVQIFNKNGKYLGKIKTEPHVPFHRPTGMAFDQNNHLYLVNRGLNMVLKLKQIIGKYDLDAPLYLDNAIDVIQKEIVETEKNQKNKKDFNNLTQTNFEYDIAISYASENREIITKIAEKLKENNIRVFYDEYEKIKLWGKNLSTFFQQIYGEKSFLVLVFVSKEYSIKDWTNFEFTIARDTAKTKKTEFILPVRLDNTPFVGLPRDIAYLDLTNEGIDGIVKAVVSKINDLHRF
jgi:DNA-binding beta-propeller fold protein YncE